MPDIFDQISLEETPKGDIFDQIEYSPGKTKIPEVGRHVARTGSRIVESLAGLPGDILRTAELGARGVEKTGEKIREKIGLSPLKKEPIKSKTLPGSENIKEFSTKLFGETVLPQSKTEAFIDDIVSDAAVLAVPFKGKIPFVKSIGTAIAANTASKGAEKLGAREGGQAAAKIGTFFLSGLTGKGNVKKFWKNQYKLADEAVPVGEELRAFKLERNLDNLEDTLLQGLDTPSQQAVLKPLRQLRSKIKDGILSVKEAIASKISLNELRESLFEEVKGRTGRKGARNKLNDISHFLDNALEEYGKQNPKFYKHYNAAQEAYSGFQQSKKVANWISRVIPFGKMGKTSLLLAEALFKPATLPATGAAYVAFKSGELLTRMFKNPTLRKYYGNLVKSSINENKSGFLKNLHKMEQEIKKNDPDIFDQLASE